MKNKKINCFIEGRIQASKTAKLTFDFSDAEGVRWKEGLGRRTSAQALLGFWYAARASKAGERHTLRGAVKEALTSRLPIEQPTSNINDMVFLLHVDRVLDALDSERPLFLP